MFQDILNRVRTWTSEPKTIKRYDELGTTSEPDLVTNR